MNKVELNDKKQRPEGRKFLKSACSPKEKVIKQHFFEYFYICFRIIFIDFFSFINKADKKNKFKKTPN